MEAVLKPSTNGKAEAVALGDWELLCNARVKHAEAIASIKACVAAQSTATAVVAVEMGGGS
jgi:hypothetical protein